MKTSTTKICSDAIAGDLRDHIHDDFRENESFYWKNRDRLLKRYQGKWIALHKGKVVTFSHDIFEVTQQVGRQKCHAYITKVGKEDQIVFKNRRVEFNYDTDYQGFALPQAHITFSNFSQSVSQKLENVIPDTGSDGTGLPLDDCRAIHLFDSPYLLASTKGVGAAGRVTPIFQGFAEINGLKCPALIQPLPQKVIFMKSRKR
jgi:hypothetical protein